MRRIMITIILMLSLILTATTTVHTLPGMPSVIDKTTNNPRNSNIPADITAQGNNVPVIQFMHRSVPDQLTSISNTFVSTNSHISLIDLSSYQIPGWILYQVTMNQENITAITERKVVGVNPKTPDNLFAINEYETGLYYDQLAQGFYNQSYDGQLQKLSIFYMTPSYDPGFSNYAYLDIRSNYQDGSTNMVSSVPLGYVGYTGTWANVTQNVILNANTAYYAVLNGTKLNQISGSYPTIRWYYEDTAGAFLTMRHTTDGDSWGSDRPYEALLNYTYIPWNKTSNSALVYSDPTAIGLSLNGTAVSGSTWTASSTSSIQQVKLSTNQSVNVFYNLSLSYKKDVTANSYWKSVSSGNPIQWNVSVDLTYPVVPETVTRFMNITSIPLDWTPTGLYLGSSPTGSYADMGTIVLCSGLSDGSWTLTSSAPNYVTDIALFDSLDSSSIGKYVSILTDMDINTTIEDGASNPMTGGSTNLTILHLGTTVFSPVEIPSSSGLASFLWNIDTTTSGNGTYLIEVHWTNGLEAGYYTTQVFVYYPTMLTADEYSITAFTNTSSAFNVGVDFNQIYPIRSLGDALTDVKYTFNNTINATLVNSGGGRWVQTIDTTNMASGIYPLTIYADGYAIENQSLTIYVKLVVETQPLNSSWSPSSTITYLGSTNLTISYLDINNAIIQGAQVNITFDGSTYAMHYDSINEVYWIQLNGTEFVTVPGTTMLNISSWKNGYAPQYNDTMSITVNPEAGVLFSVDWNPATRNITYIEQITITVNYTYNSIPINDTWEGAWVRATFNGHPLVNFTYNSGLGVWELTLNGRDYLGITTVTVRASATGYSPVQDVQTLTVVEDIPTLTSSWAGNVSSTDYETNVTLSVTITDSIGSFINDATVTINIFGTEIPMSFVADGVYSAVIEPVAMTGPHVVNVTMVRTGYQTTSIMLNLTISATTDIQINFLSSEYEQYNLTITVSYTDAIHHTPIENATVMATLNGVDYSLQYQNATGVYTTEIMLNVAPGPYTISVTANGKYGNFASSSLSLTVLPKKAVYLSLSTEGSPSVQGQILSIIATLKYNESDTAVTNVNIYFVVTLYYTNGTIEIRNRSSQFDTTNVDGVASWGFEIPTGALDEIKVEAFFNGDRDKWGTHLTQVVEVTGNPIVLLFSFFFMHSIGRLILITFALLGVVAIGYNKGIKPKKRAARSNLESQLQMFVDLESLRHFMAIYLDRGTCVFYHPFTDERIQPDLISGFIAAITSVYGEIKGDGVRGTLEEIQYHGLRLNSYSGEFIIGILILEGEMTPLLRERLQFFVELFENQYDQELHGWSGLIDCFDPEWVVSNLNSAFNYSWHLPHRFGPTQKVSKTNARILDYIGAVRDERGEFYLKNLLKPLAEMFDKSEAEILDILFHMEERGLIVSVSTQTILQRQGMGLAEGDMEGITIPLPPELTKEIEQKEEPKEKRKEKRKKEKKEKTEDQVVEEPPVEESKTEPIKEPEEAKVEEKATEEPKKEIDPLDAFVQDVEDLLTKEKENKEDE